MLKNLLETVSRYNVLLVGDAIIDEYVYVRPQGKSPKENIITNRIVRSESFRGGVWAAEQHVGNFCQGTGIERGATVTIKRRFVEEQYITKLFEVHETENRPMGYKPLAAELYDMVLVTDFGHGAVTPFVIEGLIRNAKFLAVNAQTNSANYGFNLITKYPRADFVVLDELEARLAACDRDSPIEQVIESLGFERIIVTLGPKGSIGYDRGMFTTAPAMSEKVVDTMGAGDAFFCVTAPLAAAGADMETLCRVGNAAGAIKCGVVGHRQAVTREALLDRLETPDGP